MKRREGKIWILSFELCIWAFVECHLEKAYLKFLGGWKANPD
jgi:hypothetical protein